MAVRVRTSPKISIRQADGNLGASGGQLGATGATGVPGSVANAVPSTVLPEGLFDAFVEARAYPIVENDYRNGESQRSVLHNVTNSRKTFTQQRLLTPAQMTTLRDFYVARKGPVEPFYGYNPFETSPAFSHDPTGAATAGRYTLRFEGEWNQTMQLPRGQAPVQLVETA